MKKITKGCLLLTLLGTSLFTLASCGGEKPQSGKYTYNTYLASSPKTWNTHNWQLNEEGYIQSFTEMGLYDCILNDTKDGYKFVTEMASEFPVDAYAEDLLTDEEYEDALTRYGYGGNLSDGYVWEIKLNPNAKWEDGTPITANDYVESMKRQLDPTMVNFRADSYYASNLVLANAEKYFKQHRQTIEALYDYIDLDTGNFKNSTVCEDGKYYINLGEYTPYIATIFSNAETSTTFYSALNQFSTDGSQSNALRLAANRIIDGVGEYLLQYADHSLIPDWDDEAEKVSDIKDTMWNYDLDIDEFDYNEVKVRTDIEGKQEKEVYTSSMLKKDLYTFVSTIGRGGATSKEWSWKMPLFGTVYNDYDVAWEDVGIKQTGEYSFRLYLSKKISSLDLRFALSSNWLVNIPLYDKLTTTVGGLKATSYATNSVKNYVSYGPYKLVKFEAGKSFTMERNENWYGYTDGKHEGQFQMTGIKTSVISDHNTVRGEFEKGNLDDFEMNKADMKDYGNSSRRTTTYESYTQKISFNSDRNKLAARQTNGTNKTILANDNFRKALSLAMDRNTFASQTTAGSIGFTGLLNDLYLTDVEIGEMYRNTKQGKSVYETVYKELGGDPYAENYEVGALAESANGYNRQMAIYLCAQALKEELASTESGHLNPTDTIDLEFRVFDNESETTKDMMDFMSKAFTSLISDASAKLKEENPTQYSNLNVKFNLSVIKDEDYYNTAKNGGYDLIFSIWGGAAINPYGLMQVYCDTTFDQCCEYGFKGKQGSINLYIDKNGDGQVQEDETKSYNAWYQYLTGNDLVEPEGERNDDGSFVDESLQAQYDKIHSEKLNILAGLEIGILNRFEAVPLLARGTSSLTSFKVENATSTYINLVGYGGVRFMKFNYDDKEWYDFTHSKQYSADLYKN